MKIGIDLHTASGITQGTRTYTINIVKHLLKLDHQNEYNLYVTGNHNYFKSLFSQENVFFKKVFPPQRLIRIPFSFPIKLAMDSIDIFHCQYMGPPFSLTPQIVMLHDIIHEYMPEHYPKSLCRLMQMFYPLSARKASRILTVSESSKRDIMKYYKIPEHKIIVTYNGVSEDFHPINDKEKSKDILNKYGIKGEYILYVGRLEPRKNISGLIKAYHQIKRNNVKHKLVLAGTKYFQHEEIFETVNNLELQEEVIFPGSIKDEDLPLLYNCATLFVYPTFAEGFGIPPLEAMACGTPVISSNTSSIPEVVGNAGILIDPYNTEELASAILTVLRDSNLRERMKFEGLKRAKSFTWENAAKKTLMAYYEIYDEGKKGKTTQNTVNKWLL